MDARWMHDKTNGKGPVHLFKPVPDGSDSTIAWTLCGHTASEVWLCPAAEYERRCKRCLAAAERSAKVSR